MKASAGEKFTKLGSNGRYSVFYPEGEADTSPQGVLGELERTISRSDAMLLLPDGNAQDELSRFNKFYTLFSLIVAKQLIARDMQKPVIIINHDGSWDEAIANHDYLANQGMTKDHSIQWPEAVGGLPRDARIRSNAYFDEVKAGNEDDAYRTALKLLDKKRERYRRRTPAQEVEREDGTAPDPGKFHVAVFCSAGNENEKLNAQMKKLGGWMAKEDFGVVYGAGDRYTMGALLQGVLQQREKFIEEGMEQEQAKKCAYIAGFSTPPILVSETTQGRFPTGLSYHKQTKNIYDRMAGILSVSDAVVVAPGGAGTLQEWVAALMLKKSQPEIFGNKPIVVYNPTLFKKDGEKKVWDLALKSLLGKDYALLTNDNRNARSAKERCCQKLGIYVETELKDVEDRLETLRKKTNKWQNREADAKPAPRNL